MDDIDVVVSVMFEWCLVLIFCFFSFCLSKKTMYCDCNLFELSSLIQYTHCIVWWTFNRSGRPYITNNNWWAEKKIDKNKFNVNIKRFSDWMGEKKNDLYRIITCVRCAKVISHFKHHFLFLFYPNRLATNGLFVWWY